MTNPEQQIEPPDPYFNYDESDFDGDAWDDHTDMVMFILSQGASIDEWMDMMTPYWQEQIRQMKAQGWLRD